MKNIKITIEYNGCGYSGWQRQLNGVSIEETIDTVLSKVTNEKIKLFGASRTDAGVHARGQVANFTTNCVIPANKYPAVLNGKLPKDIVILQGEEVPLNFHARYHTTGKTYSYTILNRKIRPAYMDNYLAYCQYDLNFENMERAARYFMGTHDFTAFKSKGGSVITSVRTINKIELSKENQIIKLIIEGDAFLYNMVRIIAGTLIDVGRGRIPYASIPDIILSKDRTRAGKTAPASGLCLEQIYYQTL
jgi:tRNA pseudouridine38-40 synthase